jgi:hypothetical protein
MRPRLLASLDAAHATMRNIAQDKKKGDGKKDKDEKAPKKSEKTKPKTAAEAKAKGKAKATSDEEVEVIDTDAEPAAEEPKPSADAEGSDDEAQPEKPADSDEKPEPDGTADADADADADAAAEEAEEAEEEDEAPKKEAPKAEPKYVERKDSATLRASVGNGVSLAHLSAEGKRRSRKRLETIRDEDKAEKERGTLLNKLEADSVELADKMEVDESISQVSTQLQRDEIKEELADLAKWLQEAGPKASIKILEKRIAKLQDLSAPLLLRATELSARPTAVGNAREASRELKETVRHRQSRPKQSCPPAVSRLECIIVRWLGDAACLGR